MSTPTPIQTHTAIRRARPAEAAAISALALRSKGHWGYDAAFLESCREDLTVSPQEIAAERVYVAVGSDGTMTGYYSLKPAAEGVVELDALFVDPAAIGQGVGRALWEHAVRTAKAAGYRQLVIQSDPHAEGFYRAMGAVSMGERESSVTPGRFLPLLRYGLQDRFER